MKPEETKARILDASDQLFGELGFDATSTRDIAERSGVNKALIHYHFGTKDVLLDVLLDGYYERLTAELVAAMARRTEPEEQAEDLLDAYADFLAKNRTFSSIVQREVASGHHVEKIVRRTLPVFRLGTTWLGQIAPDAPAGLELVHVLTSVYGMVVTYFTFGRVLHQLDGVDPFSPDALEGRKRHVRRVVALLFRELRASAKPTKKDPTWPRSTPRTPRKNNAS
ncbi:MAG TPA: TetR family transcriptional regulator [Polyangiaceae bacterium]